MRLQSKELTMLGLGAKGDKQLLDGAHLRWFFDPEMGFPRYGFQLFKGFAKHGDKSCPEVCFPGYKDRWAQYESQREPGLLQKDDLTIRCEDPNAIQNDGIDLGVSGQVEANVPEPCKAISLTIEWRPKKTVDPIIPGKWVPPLKKPRPKIPGKLKSVADRLRLKQGKTVIKRPTRPIPGPVIPKPPIINWPQPPIIDLPKPPVIDWPLPVYLDITFLTAGKHVHTTTKPLKEGINNIVLKADSLTELSFSVKGPNKTMKQNTFLFSRICWMPVATCVDFYDWESIDRTCLPIKDPRVPCSPDVESEWESADQRIKLKDPAQRIYNERQFREELLPYIREMVKHFPSPQHEVTKQLTAAESSTESAQMAPFSLPILNSLLLAAMEPEMAQMLGLYSLDEQVDSESHPYMIVGYWHKPGRYRNEKEKQNDLYRLGLTGLPSQRNTFTFEKNGFRFLSHTNMSKPASNGYPGIRVRDLDIVFPRALSMILPVVKAVGSSHLYIQVEKQDGTILNFPGGVDKIDRVIEELDQGLVSLKIYGDFILQDFYYAEMNYAWITHDVGFEHTQELPVPEGMQGQRLPGKGYVENAGKGLMSYGTVGLTWNPPTPVFEHFSNQVSDDRQTIGVSVHPAYTHVMHKLERADIGRDPDIPLSEKHYEWVNRGRAILPTKRPTEERVKPVNYPAGWPTQHETMREQGWPPFFYMDAGDKNERGEWTRFLAKDHWYAYRLYGIDWFGRQSKPGQPYKVQIKDTLPPPPPMPIQAKFLDPQDPYLEKREWEWITEENANRPGFRVQWRWSDNLQRQAPDVRYFNLYFHAGQWNVWEGTLRSVSDQGVYSRLEVVLDRAPTFTAHALNGKVLRQSNINYKIVSHTTSTITGSQSALTVTVKNPTNPKIVPVKNKPLTIRVDEGVGGFQDVRVPDVWSGDPASTLLASIPVRNGGSFDYYVDERQLPANLKLVTDASRPLRFGYFGISAVDDSGNEGPVTSPLQVTVVHREKPTPPEAADSDQLWASYPDYHSRSTFKVKWPVTADDQHYTYQVYRTMDQSLIRADRDAHLRGHLGADGELQPEVIRALFDESVQDPRALEVKNELLQLDEKIADWERALADEKQALMRVLTKKYMTLRNDTWRYIASLEENATVFAPVSRPLDPTRDDQWLNTNQMAYEDHIEGTGRNRYYYRIGRMDAAGNRSQLGMSTLPVAVPDVVPPKAPVIVRAEGKNRQVMLRWRKNREPGMKRYEVYRTTRPEEAKDIRLMGAPVRIIDANEEGTPAHEIEMIDEPLDAGRYDYRLVAVREGAIGQDSAGNERTYELSSYPTETVGVCVLSRLTAPTWQTGQWVKVDSQGQLYDWANADPDLSPAILLEWQHDTPYRIDIVQRKTEESWIWQTVSPEISGPGQFMDAQADPGLDTQYRIRTTSDTGEQTFTEIRTVASVDPNEEG